MVRVGLSFARVVLYGQVHLQQVPFVLSRFEHLSKEEEALVAVLILFVAPNRFVAAWVSIFLDPEFVFDFAFE